MIPITNPIVPAVPIKAGPKNSIATFNLTKVVIATPAIRSRGPKAATIPPKITIIFWPTGDILRKASIKRVIPPTTFASIGSRICWMIIPADSIAPNICSILEAKLSCIVAAI